jgi:ribosomal protein S24E
MQIIKEFRNELLKRKEILFSFEAASNPGYETSKKMIVEKTKADPEKVAVKSVRGNFGSKEFVVEVFVYDKKEDKDRIEPKPKMKKGAEGAK